VITLWVDFDIVRDRTIKIDFSSDQDLYHHEQQAVALLIERIEKTVTPNIMHRVMDQRCKTGIMARLNYLSKEIFAQTNVKIDVQEVLPKRCTCVCTCGAI
jgi:hypothetical protein